ncbi:MAG: hypothetical protein IKZ10_01330 [Akkermansia sp.]|nr:hypothetical protein [Akkermansia sp.]
MAIHIQMSEEAEKALKRASLRNKLSALLSCILFILLGGAILVYVVYHVVQAAPASFVSYKPKAKPNAKTTRKQPSEENAIQEEASASDPTTPVIVSNSPNAVPMPIATSMADMGEGLSADIGIGDGLGAGDLGDGLGGGGDGMGSKEGGGSTLEGTFYDLKLKRNGAPSGLNGGPANEGGVVAALSKFFTSWNEAELNKYYKSETKLYASSWYLPVAAAKYAPIAYEVGDPKKPESQWECKPAAWIAVYRGKVVAPKTGKFRFIGTGDDFLAVRFNRKTVLEAGYRAPSYYDKSNPTGCYISEPAKRAEFLKKRKGYEMITSVTGCGKWNGEIGGLVAGAEFSVREGEAYPIEIAISEIPGGCFGFVLFIEDVTEGKNSKAKQYDLFRTCDTNPDIDKVMKALQETGCSWPGGTTRIPFNEDSWVWESVPMD